MARRKEAAMATDISGGFFNNAVKLREHIGRRIGGVCVRAIIGASTNSLTRLSCEVDMNAEGWRDLIAAEAGTGTGADESGPCEVVRGVVVETDISNKVRTCSVSYVTHPTGPVTVVGLPWPTPDLKCLDEVTITVRKVGHSARGCA